MVEHSLLIHSIYESHRQKRRMNVHRLASVEEVEVAYNTSMNIQKAQIQSHLKAV